MFNYPANKTAAFRFGSMVWAMLWVATAGATPPSAPSTRPPDDVTKAKVEAALAADPDLIGRRVQVTVKEGVVTLSGFVDSTHDLIVAHRDAQSIPGVVRIVEELTVEHGGTPP
jgi:osmotically-inducible protein OsmY